MNIGGEVNKKEIANECDSSNGVRIPTQGERFEELTKLVKRAEQNMQLAARKTEEARQDLQFCEVIWHARREELNRFLRSTGARI